MCECIGEGCLSDADHAACGGVVITMSTKAVDQTVVMMEVSPLWIDMKAQGRHG